MTAPESGGQASTSGEAGTHPRFCGHCGSAVEPGRPLCPACGAAVTPLASEATVAASAVSAPVSRVAETTHAWAVPPPAAAPPLPYITAEQTPYHPTLVAAPPPPAPSGWADDDASTTWSDGMAQAAYTPTNPATRRARPRHRLLAAVSTLLLLAVLGTTGYWLYGVFAAHQEAAAARYVPANTILFAGIDMVQAAQNGHHVSSTDLGNGTGQGDALKQATGLNWNNDILPWLGRDIAFAVFPVAVVPGNGPQYPRVGYVYLLQSRDDTAAQAAMKKAADFQTRQGNTIATSSYAGFTLYSVTPQYGNSSSAIVSGSGGTTTSGPGAPVSSGPMVAGPITGTTVTAGNGWALVASDSLAAHAVIDRINAGGNGLDTNAAFQAATRDLTANCFATLFINLRAVVSATSPQDVTQPDVPFLDAYPAAGGFAEWTNTGVRGVIELPGQRPASVPDLSGDTTSLAQMIPAGALLYSGTANFGTAYQAIESLMPAPTNGSTPSDAFTQYFGQPASSAAFQQPAAFAELRQAGADQPGQVPGLVALIRAPDAAAATAALRTTAQAQHWTLKPATVAGTPVTDVYAPVPYPIYSTAPGTVLPPPAPATPPSTPTPQGFPRSGSPAPQTELLGVATQVKGTFVFAGSPEDLAAVLRVASGSAPSLASAATFQQLVSGAPSGAISTSYVNLAALLSHTPPSGGTLLTRAASMLVTTVWSQSQIAITADVQLQG